MNAITIYNTFTQKKELFTALQPGKVGLYVCGPTVYDHCHVGHARVYLVFDVITRFLRYSGYEVTYVRNITDIDDKIIKRARENQESCSVLTERVIKAMHQDFAALNIVEPTIEPRATDYIPQMLDMIQTLIDKRFAYVGATGDVYYNIEKFSSYGCLSHRNLDDLKEGARVAVDQAKKNPLDFVLWKKAKADEPAWDSPWGPGRPGWHIECSAMSLQNLGETLDIHGGGPDLIFPHHENERAQSEAATDQDFVKYWMHVGYVQRDKKKMSKSEGNFSTIRDFLAKYDGEVLRYFAISSHYRSPIEYSLEHIDCAAKALNRLYIALNIAGASAEVEADTRFEQQFELSMCDDINTPEALAVLFELAHEIHRLKSSDIEKAMRLVALLKKMGNLLGILQHDPIAYLQNLDGKNITPEEIEVFIAKRNQARVNKEWSEADRIRNELWSRGIALEDTQVQTTWYVTG